MAENPESLNSNTLIEGLETGGNPPESPFGFRFDYTPPPGGYSWWYIDGVSDDGNNALVVIIFVGSVFSPYYAWKNWTNPSDHCAINVALYGPPQRWSMTERPNKNTRRTPATYETGNSRVRLVEGGLEIAFDEIGAPIPRRMRGIIRVDLPYLSAEPFQLDPNARHFWSPACTHARVSVDFEKPGLSWQGHGYVDSNYGLEPVTRGFDYWDWSRTPLENGDTLIRYVTDSVAGPQRDLNISIGKDGTIQPAAYSESTQLPSTSIWRINRRAGLLNHADPFIVQTLEDTPFYSRSIINYPSGTSGYATHETLSCRRLRSPIVRAMLPFRMPRLSV
ncbi:MAG: carotenoid 1,2-hydratase [Pseudomonadota bacterium]